MDQRDKSVGASPSLPHFSALLDRSVLNGQLSVQADQQTISDALARQKEGQSSLRAWGEASVNRSSRRSEGGVDDEQRARDCRPLFRQLLSHSLSLLHTGYGQELRDLPYPFRADSQEWEVQEAARRS